MDQNQSLENHTTLPAQPDVKRRKKLLKWGLVCLIAPSIIFVLAVFIAAINNYLFYESASQIGAAPNATEITHTILNVLVFLMGAVTVLTWLPGIIIGIILLVKRAG